MCKITHFQYHNDTYKHTTHQCVDTHRYYIKVTGNNSGTILKCNGVRQSNDPFDIIADKRGNLAGKALPLKQGALSHQKN